ncbi:MAG: hypothetical protein EBR02_06290 [Alphaproteobacteria bacterium]|nr:hypothetical protein [Alphaproteobacteria bacterium]
MQHLELHEVKNNISIESAATESIPETGSINIFFPGADGFGSKIPDQKLKKTVIEYIDDRKIKDANWKLYFAQQKDTGAINCADVEKENRIQKFNDLTPFGGRHYLAEDIEFVNDFLLPIKYASRLKTPEGERISGVRDQDEVHKAKMRLSRFNLLGFCYGTIKVQQILLAIDSVLKERGYDRCEINDIKKSICCINYAPICEIPSENRDVPQIFFAFEQDKVAERRINYKQLIQQLKQEQEATGEPSSWRSCEGKYDIVRPGKSVMLLSHLAEPLPYALRLRKREHRLGEDPTTINPNDDGYGTTLKIIRQGRVEVQKITPARRDAIEKMGHNLRVFFNIERLTGNQARGDETFAFPSTLFARWTHDVLLASIKGSHWSASTGEPRNMEGILNSEYAVLTEGNIQARTQRFEEAPKRFADMVEAARTAGTFVENGM